MREEHVHEADLSLQRRVPASLLLRVLVVLEGGVGRQILVATVPLEAGSAGGEHAAPVAVLAWMGPQTAAAPP